VDFEKMRIFKKRNCNSAETNVDSTTPALESFLSQKELKSFYFNGGKLFYCQTPEVLSKLLHCFI
jgi:hypothetical protein